MKKSDVYTRVFLLFFFFANTRYFSYPFGGENILEYIQRTEIRSNVQVYNIRATQQRCIQQQNGNYVKQNGYNIIIYDRRRTDNRGTAVSCQYRPADRWILPFTSYIHILLYIGGGVRHVYIVQYTHISLSSLQMQITKSDVG